MAADIPPPPAQATLMQETQRKRMPAWAWAIIAAVTILIAVLAFVAGGLCLAALFDNPGRYWLLSLLIVLMAAFTVVAPLIGMTFTRRAVSEFNNRWFRQRWREPYVRLIGLAALALSVVSLVYELRA